MSFAVAFFVLTLALPFMVGVVCWALAPRLGFEAFVAWLVCGVLVAVATHVTVAFAVLPPLNFDGSGPLVVFGYVVWVIGLAIVSGYLAQDARMKRGEVQTHNITTLSEERRKRR